MMLSKNIIDTIRNRFAPPTTDSVSADRSRRQGVMSRTSERMVEALESTAEQSLETLESVESTPEKALESVAELSAKTRAARTPKDSTESFSMEDVSMSGEFLNTPPTYTEGLIRPVGKPAASVEDLSELEILAKTIEAEARGESYEGKIAVGAVIANRAASGKYGNGIKGVILKKGAFSPWNSYTGYAKGEQGQDMFALIPSQDSYAAASAILKAEYSDPTKGATHYLNDAVSRPDWLKEMKNRKRGTLRLGNHLFGNADSEKTYDGKSWLSRRSN